MANKMKIVYYISWGIGQFPHMFPYYKEIGGLVYTTNDIAKAQLQKEYGEINVTSDFEDVKSYDPDIMMYPDYHKMIRELKAKNVLVFHAIELKGYYSARAEWNNCEEFDLCLLYSKKMLQDFEDKGWNIKYKIIGYPKLDNIINLKYKIFDNNKKTILVAPTWGDLSLLHKFKYEIIKLSKKYNIILKPHPLTTISNYRDNNQDNMKVLINAKSDSLKIFGNADILPLMNISDMIITDYSGSSCEFMHFNKPIIIAKPDSIPSMSLKKPDIWKVFKVCNNATDLADIVKKQFKNDDMKNERNEYFKSLIYTEKNTTATQRGILAMKELLNE